MEVAVINELKSGVAPIPSTPAMEVEQRREMIQAVRAVNAAELYGQENELSFAKPMRFKSLVQFACLAVFGKECRQGRYTILFIKPKIKNIVAELNQASKFVQGDLFFAIRRWNYQ